MTLFDVSRKSCLPRFRAALGMNPISSPVSTSGFSAVLRPRCRFPVLRRLRFNDGAGYVSSVPRDRAKLPRASPLTGFTALDGRLILVSPRCHTGRNALLLALLTAYARPGCSVGGSCWLIVFCRCSLMAPALGRDGGYSADLALRRTSASVSSVEGLPTRCAFFSLGFCRFWAFITRAAYLLRSACLRRAVRSATFMPSPDAMGSSRCAASMLAKRLPSSRQTKLLQG